MYELGGGSGVTGMNGIGVAVVSVFGAGVGAIVGVIGGIIVGLLPQVKSSFAKSPLLYYIPSALSVVVSTLVLHSVFF